MSQTVTVTGVDDGVDDGTVTWDVRLDTSSANGSDYDAVPDMDVSVTTTDDDDAPGVTLSLNPTSIAESGGTATVRATLNRASDEVTAVANAYSVASGAGATIVVSAGATTTTDTATITAVDNAVDAPDKEVTVSGTAANDRASADSATMTVTGATLTIADDDERGLTGGLRLAPRANGRGLSLSVSPGWGLAHPAQYPGALLHFPQQYPARVRCDLAPVESTTSQSTRSVPMEGRFWKALKAAQGSDGAHGRPSNT